MGLAIRNVGLLALAVVGIASRARADIIVVPPDLSVGDTYRLVFVTYDPILATSTNIADYNTFVTSEADEVSALAALDATWTVIGSTATVDAATNVGSSTSGIYNLEGEMVADGTANLFSAYGVVNPIEYDQFGNPTDEMVWTGSNWDGTADSPFTLGWFLATAFGESDETTFGSALNNGFTCCGSQVAEPIYAISSEITVTASTPEPGAVALSALGGIFLLLARKRQRRNYSAT